jgi:hypothetical protein
MRRLQKRKDVSNTRHKGRRWRSWFRIVAEVIGTLAAITTILGYLINESKNSEDRISIYEYFSKILTRRDSTIVELRMENFILRNQTVKTRTTSRAMEVFFGKVVSDSNVDLTDVHIIVIGGSEVYSFSNGEFYIDCQVGQRVRFVHSSFTPIEILVTKELMNIYNIITLHKGNRK